MIKRFAYFASAVINGASRPVYIVSNETLDPEPDESTRAQLFQQYLTDNDVESSGPNDRLEIIGPVRAGSISRLKPVMYAGKTPVMCLVWNSHSRFVSRVIWVPSDMDETDIDALLQNIAKLNGRSVSDILLDDNRADILTDADVIVEPDASTPCQSVLHVSGNSIRAMPV